MRLFHVGKDGGYESSVFGYWLIELKALFSIVLLKFVGRSREAYHTHAFSSLSWVLRGELREQMIAGTVKIHRPSIVPILTRRSTFHKVDSDGVTWVFSLRGPWADHWFEHRPTEGYRLLVNGRGEPEPVY